MRRVALMLFLALAPAPAAQAGTPLSASARASAETLLGAVKADPFAEEPLAALERTYERGPGREALADELRHRASAEPNELGWHVALARMALEAGRRADGVRELERAVEVAKDAAAARRLARMLDDNGARAAAVKAYRAGLAGASRGEERQLQLRLGALLYADGKAAEAKVAWSRALELSPDDPELRRQIAEALAARGAYRDALDQLRAIEPLVAHDTSAKVALLRREAEVSRRATPGARAEAGQALVRAFRVAADGSKWALAAECAADLLRLYGVRPPKARVPDELTALVKRAEKDDARAAALVGEVLAAGGDAGAADAFRRALSADPRNAWVLRRLCAFEHGEQRLQHLAQLALLEPNDAGLQIERVRALFEVGRSDEAAQAARTLARAFGDSPPVLDELSTLLMEKDRPAEALPVLERLLALDGDRPDALVRYGDALHALHHDSEATRSWFRLVEKDSSTASYRHLIEVLERRNLPNEVKRAYLQALARGEDPVLRRDYARFLSSRNLFDEAIGEWKKVHDAAKDAFLRDYAEREIKRLQWQSMLNR